MAHIAFSDDHGDKILYSSAWKYEKCASYAWMAGSLNLSTYGNRARWLASSPLFPYVGKSWCFQVSSRQGCSQDNEQAEDICQRVNTST
jgi:hypothetical protein